MASSTKKKEKEITELDVLKNIERKIDKLTGIIAVQGKDEYIQIRILNKMGLTSQEISELLGLTSSAVRMRMSRKKSSKTPKKSK